MTDPRDVDALVERLQHCSKNTRDEYLHELTGRAATTITALQAEVAALREENKSLRHWSVGHIDALLLYAAGSYPNDSHVKDAVAFCRIVAPKFRLRMDPLEGSDFHPARAALGQQP